MPPAKPAERAPVPACRVAERNHEHEEQGNDDDAVGQDGEQAVHGCLPESGLCHRGFVVIVGIIVISASHITGCRTAEAHTIDVRNGVGHVPGTGGHGAIVVLGGKVILHGLGDGTGLAGQCCVLEAVAAGQVVVAVGVLGALHHQQDENTVVLRAAAQAPGVGGLHGVILRGDAARVIHGQHADLGTLAAGIQLGVQILNGLHGAAAQDIGIVHNALVFGQVRQAGRCRKGGRHKGCQPYSGHQHQSADAPGKEFHRFHAKGSTSLIPNRPFSRVAGKPLVSF